MQRTAKHIQGLLRGNKMVLDIFRKALVQGLQILQFLYQCTSLLCVRNELRHVLCADTILHKFRDGTLHLMNIALLMNMSQG
mgnify:CR=1 FL=1